MPAGGPHCNRETALRPSPVIFSVPRISRLCLSGRVAHMTFSKMVPDTYSVAYFGRVRADIVFAIASDTFVSQRPGAFRQF